MLFEVLLIGINHTVQPRQKLFGAVIAVKHNWYSIGGSNSTNVVGSSNGTCNGGFLATIGNTFTGKVCGTTLRGLENDGRLLVAGSLEGADDSGGAGYIDGGNGIVVLLCVLEELEDVVACDAFGCALVCFVVECGRQKTYTPALRERTS
jgi:hypothetical protein